MGRKIINYSDGKKTCKLCGEHKNLDQFYKTSKGQPFTRCKICHNIKTPTFSATEVSSLPEIVSEEIIVQENNNSPEEINSENKELQQVSDANETITNSENPVTKLIISDEFRDLLPPLTSDEYCLLEESLIRDKLKEPIEVWDNMIIDGHNRYEICNKHGIEIKIKELHFNDCEAAIDYILRKQISRRNLSDKKRNYAWGELYLCRKKNNALRGQNVPQKNIAKLLADELKVSSKTIKRAGKYSEAINKLNSVYGSDLKFILLNKEMKISDNNVLKYADKCAEVNEEIKTSIVNNNYNTIKNKINNLINIPEDRPNNASNNAQENIQEYVPNSCPKCHSTDHITLIKLVNNTSNTEIQSKMKLCLNCKILLEQIEDNKYTQKITVMGADNTSKKINPTRIIELIAKTTVEN